MGPEFSAQQRLREASIAPVERSTLSGSLLEPLLLYSWNLRVQAKMSTTFEQSQANKQRDILLWVKLPSIARRKFALVKGASDTIYSSVSFS